MEDINGKMERSTKVNGKQVSSMVLEFGVELREILILDNGRMAMLKVMVFIPGLMEIDIKVNFKIVLNMGKVSNVFLMVILIKVIISKVNPQVMVNIIGLVAVFSKEILRLAYVMVKEYGRKVLDGVINIKGNGWMIKNMDMEFLCGLMEVYIVGIM